MISAAFRRPHGGCRCADARLFSGDDSSGDSAGDGRGSYKNGAASSAAAARCIGRRVGGCGPLKMGLAAVAVIRGALNFHQAGTCEVKIEVYLDTFSNNYHNTLLLYPVIHVYLYTRT